jgi:hypothetical protein
MLHVGKHLVAPEGPGDVGHRVEAVTRQHLHGDALVALEHVLVAAQQDPDELLLRQIDEALVH